MSSVNKVMILGRVGQDPEIRYMPNGDAVANVSVATSRTWKDKGSNEKHEETEWHRCTLYQRQAEIVGEYVKKGDLIHFEGRLKTRKWQDKQGNDRYTTEIIVEQLQLIGKTERREGGGQQQRPSAPAQAPRPQQQRTGTGFDDMDDDIPF